jgi:hypothetical protein
VRREYDRHASKNIRHPSQSYSGRTFVSSQVEREIDPRPSGHGSHRVRDGHPCQCTRNHSVPILREVPPTVKDWHDNDSGYIKWERSERDFPYWEARVRSRMSTFESQRDVMRAIDIVLESWSEACNRFMQMERDKTTVTKEIEDANDYLEELRKRRYLSPSKEHDLQELLTMYSRDRRYITERHHCLEKEINRMREEWIELEYIIAEMKRVDGEYNRDSEEQRFGRELRPPRMPSEGRVWERRHRF